MSWFFIPPGNPVSPSGSFQMDLDYERDKKKKVVKKKNCECGAEKTFGKDTTFHSDYCPKYKK